MVAEIISVGTELLLGQIVDTDAAYAAQALSRLGISIYYRTTVGDNAARLHETLQRAFSRADSVITVGGLGPTMDDLTKEVVGEVLSVAFVEDEAHRLWLQKLLKDRGLDRQPPSFMKQALVPAEGRGIPNPNGTALGALFEKNGKIAICLPGPPNEFIPMVDDSVIPYLAERTLGERAVIKSRVLRVIGLGESLVEDRIKDLMDSANPTVAPYAKTGEVHLRITARASSDDAAEALIAPQEAEIRERLGDLIYGIDDQTLEQVIVELLIARNMTITVAESCSGGLIAKRVTDVPDASKVFGLGLVTYSDEAKSRFLNVSQELLRAHGAVSPEVAKAMAVGAREAAGADLAVSVTGVAGPGGGSVEKPVGTVHIGFAWDNGVISEHNVYLGTRAHIAQRAANSALALVRLRLIDPGNARFKS